MGEGEHTNIEIWLETSGQSSTLKKQGGKVHYKEINHIWGECLSHKSNKEGDSSQKAMVVHLFTAVKAVWGSFTRMRLYHWHMSGWKLYRSLVSQHLWAAQGGSALRNTMLAGEVRRGKCSNASGWSTAKDSLWMHSAPWVLALGKTVVAGGCFQQSLRGRAAPSCNPFTAKKVKHESHYFENLFFWWALFTPKSDKTASGSK